MDERSPVIVLAHAYAGVPQIQRLLSGSSLLACTAGTGVLPLCAEAAATWRQVENRGGPLSALALSSVRALASSMITVILAGSGKSRWCETSFSPASAETFLQLYPGAKFICLHRSCPDAVRAGIEASPWGLAGAGLGSFTAAYPGSSAAALAAYWADRTESMHRFQQEHPAACHQVRYEDLDGSPGPAARHVFAFLGLDLAVTPGQATETASGRPERDALPAGVLPRPLAARVNDLQQRLGYPPIG